MRKQCKNRRAGTSLVEVLVVMVVFLVGILAVIQIYPGGIKILSNSRMVSVATALARSEMERHKGANDRLPDRIATVTATWSATGIVLTEDSDRSIDDLGPHEGLVNANGMVFDTSGNELGHWSFLTGANITRRVIGEGNTIPAPRAVGSNYGGLMVLQYAPIVFNSDYIEFFEVYGNNLAKRYGVPDDGRTRSYEYYLDELDNSSATIYLPRSTTKTLRYRLSLTAHVSDASGDHRKDVATATPIVVAPDAAGGYASFQLSDYILSSGESLQWVEGDTVSVARLFDRVSSFTSDPYEYIMLDQTMGVLLFNPAGYNYYVTTARNRRAPLVGKVNYDVLDWRIIHDDFRLPEVDRPFARLAVGGLAVKGNQGSDNKPNPGFPTPSPTGYSMTDFAVMDLDSGGVYSPNSYTVDKSLGWVTFLDADNDSSNGLQMDLLLPGAASVTTVTATSRSVRALYQVAGQWSVQVLKAPSRFRLAWDMPGAAQAYVGGSNLNLSDPGLTTRIYFPRVESGHRVSVGRINYRCAGDDPNLPPREMLGQDFVIQGKPLDSLGRPYLDIRTVDPDAVSFDYSYYGFAARDIQGSSLAVRVMWNPNFFSLTADSDQNMRNLNTYMNGWRKTQTETFLQRGED